MKDKGLFIGLLILNVVVGIFVYRQMHKKTAVKESQSSVIDSARVEAKKIATSVDQKGYAKTAYERKAAIIGSGDISKLPVSKAVYDSLRLDNLDKTKQLQQASLISATLEAKAVRALKMVDSLNSLRYYYKDQYADIGFTPDSLGGKFDWRYNIKLIRHDYTKGRKNFTDILSPDKRITIDGLQSLTIESPKPGRFGVGLQAGYYYDPYHRQFLPAVGLGLTYSLYNF